VTRETTWRLSPGPQARPSVDPKCSATAAANPPPEPTAWPKKTFTQTGDLVQAPRGRAMPSIGNSPSKAGSGFSNESRSGRKALGGIRPKSAPVARRTVSPPRQSCDRRLPGCPPEPSVSQCRLPRRSCEWKRLFVAAMFHAAVQSPPPPRFSNRLKSYYPARSTENTSLRSSRQGSFPVLLGPRPAGSCSHRALAFLAGPREPHLVLIPAWNPEPLRLAFHGPRTGSRSGHGESAACLRAAAPPAFLPHPQPSTRSR